MTPYDAMIEVLSAACNSDKFGSEMTPQEQAETFAVEYAVNETMWSHNWSAYLVEFEAALVERLGV